jgi:peptidyl-tRNA hydrolase
MEAKKDLVVYILSRNDLPSLNPGKAMAQIHHAGVHMMSKYNKSALVKEYISSGIKNGADHFNTTLVLSASMLDIKTCIHQVKKLSNVEHGTVIDPSYPFVVDNDEIANLISSAKRLGSLPTGKVVMTRKELTCAWFLGDKSNNAFKGIFSSYPLHP